MKTWWRREGQGESSGGGLAAGKKGVAGGFACLRGGVGVSAQALAQ